LHWRVSIVYSQTYVLLNVIKYYLDTSVYGGYFDPEFEIVTRQWFDRFLSEDAVIVQSFLTNIEICNAPTKVRDLYHSTPSERIIHVDYSAEIDQLAIRYIEAGVNNQNNIADCLHVATASVSAADALISWDFKHILHPDRVLGYLTINQLAAVPKLKILSPNEALNNEY